MLRLAGKPPHHSGRVSSNVRQHDNLCRALRSPAKRPMPTRQWSTTDFEQMSWHDCHVHGFRVTEGEHGAGEIEFDLDYILEWRCKGEGYSFLVAPATLRFHQVTDLRIAIDWSAPIAALGPFSLAGIERRSEPRPLHTAAVWVLQINWPEGNIQFESTGFTQCTWGREVLSMQQGLAPSERSAA